jgi:hypothetical protein
MSIVEVYIPSVKVESEVSFVFRWFVMVLVRMCVNVFLCVCIIPLVYYMTFSFCFEEYCCMGLKHCSLLEIHRYFKRAQCLPASWYKWWVQHCLWNLVAVYNLSHTKYCLAVTTMRTLIPN